jgi:hypothetical protein
MDSRVQVIIKADHGRDKFSFPAILNIAMRWMWPETGFGLVTGFIAHLQNVTTNDSLTELHTRKITVTKHK